MAMADNYLERKMEEHRSGHVARQVRLMRNPAGTLLVSFPYKSAFVYAEKADEIASGLVALLRSTGCRVGIASPDKDACRRISKAKDAYFIPADTAAGAFAMHCELHGSPDLSFNISGGIIHIGGKALGDDPEKALLRLLLI
ncbi:MAG: hypothetical protein K2F79_00670 [Muribaculaceae bacterium]|nr:hypothetical protein [Muribaculaceae bacterium]